MRLVGQNEVSVLLHVHVVLQRDLLGLVVLVDHLGLDILAIKQVIRTYET